MTAKHLKAVFCLFALFALMASGCVQGTASEEEGPYSVIRQALPADFSAQCTTPAPTTIVVIIDGWYGGLDDNMLKLTKESYKKATNQELDMNLVLRQDGRDFDSRCYDGYAYHSDLTRFAGRINSHASSHCPTKSDCNLLIVSRSYGSVITHNTLISYAHELMEYRKVGVMLIDPYGIGQHVIEGTPGCKKEHLYGRDRKGNERNHFQWKGAKWDTKFNAGDFLLGHVYQTVDWPGGTRWESDHCTTKMFDGECHNLGSVIHFHTTLHAMTKAVLTRLIGTLIGNTLFNSLPVQRLSCSEDSFTYWTMEVPSWSLKVLPAVAVDLSFTTYGGSGDVDLYVRFGSQPTLDDFDCRSWNYNNHESCHFESPLQGTYHIMLHGYSDYSGVTLKPKHNSGVCFKYYNRLEGSGDYVIEPNNTPYNSGAGNHKGVLDGPQDNGVDFDLELHELIHGSWEKVEESISYSSHEEINYNGDSGDYRWKVVSYSGSGDYTLCIDHP